MSREEHDTVGGKNHLGLLLLGCHYFCRTPVSAVFISAYRSGGKIRGSGKKKKQLCIFEYGKTVSNDYEHDLHSLWLHLSITSEKAETFSTSHFRMKIVLVNLSMQCPVVP